MACITSCIHHYRQLTGSIGYFLAIPPAMENYRQAGNAVVVYCISAENIVDMPTLYHRMLPGHNNRNTGG